MEYKVPLFYPHVSEAQRKAVNETLKTRWIGQAGKVDQFEDDIKYKFGRAFPVAVNSGTSALELAYDLVGIGEGDEVITTVLTCTATNIPLLRRRAKIVFADINPKTLCIDLDDVRKKVTNRTKAIVGVNLGGIEHDVTDMYVKDLPIITDAAQGIGQTNGDYVIYSFQAIKHFTTGDGGMLFTPTFYKYKKAKLLRWFGIDRERKQQNDWQPYKKREMTFDIEHPGYKFQMNDVAASMGIEGLKEYDNIIKYRKNIFDFYKKSLNKVEGISVVDGRNNVYWLATLLVEDRDGFAKMLKNRGVETNLVQVRNDIYKVFGSKRLDLPNMNELEDKYISIPLHNVMTMEDAEYVVESIKGGW